MIPCTFRQIEIFVAAAEDCHFARTANRLGISQPAITHHILALERQLGKQLFIRRRGTTPLLSTDGVAFLKQSRQMLEMGATISNFRDAAEGRGVSRVRVAAGVHILEDYIKPQLHEFYERHPDILIDCIQLTDFEGGFNMVRAAQADLLVIAAAAPTAPGLYAELIRVVRFGLYASPAFAEWKAAAAAEISALPFLLRTAGAPFDVMVQEALKKADIWPTTVAARTQFTQVSINLAVRGLGVAPLFDTMVEKETARGDLIKFDIELPVRYRTLFRLDGKPSAEIRKVEAFIREILA